MILNPVMDSGNPWRLSGELMVANHGKSGLPRQPGAATHELNMGPGPREEGLGRRRGSVLDALLVPRDARGIVLACGFVAVAALGFSLLLFGDPLGYAYLLGAAMGYFFLQTRLMPTVLWLLISFGGAAGATAGNASDWIVCGLGLLLAGVSLLRVPAAFREAPAVPTLEPSRNLEPSGIRTSRNLEVEGVSAAVPHDVVKPTNGRLESPDPAAAEQLVVDAGQQSQSSGVSIRALGRLRLDVNGRDLTQRLNEQPRLEFLLSYLLARAISGAGAIDRPALADEVAPRISPGSRLDRLRKQLHALQLTLGSGAKALLRITNTHVSLDLTHIVCDFRDLQELSAQLVRRKTLVGAELAGQIRRMLDGSSGEFLAGFTDLDHQVTGGQSTASDTVSGARILVARWRADLIKALADHDEAGGHPQHSIAYLKSGLVESPDRQDLARLLVRAYLQTGQTAQATELSLEYELTQEK